MLQRDAGGEPPLPAQCLGCHTALPRPATKTSLFCGTLLGLHQNPYRCWLASTGAPRNSNAYSLGEFWVQRHAAATPVPLFAGVNTTSFGSVAGRGSAVWVRRHSAANLPLCYQVNRSIIDLYICKWKGGKVHGDTGDRPGVCHCGLWRRGS